MFIVGVKLSNGFERLGHAQRERVSPASEYTAPAMQQEEMVPAA